MFGKIFWRAFSPLFLLGCYSDVVYAAEIIQCNLKQGRVMPKKSEVLEPLKEGYVESVAKSSNSGAQFEDLQSSESEPVFYSFSSGFDIRQSKGYTYLMEQLISEYRSLKRNCNEDLSFLDPELASAKTSIDLAVPCRYTQKKYIADALIELTKYDISKREKITERLGFCECLFSLRECLATLYLDDTDIFVEYKALVETFIDSIKT